MARPKPSVRSREETLDELLDIVANAREELVAVERRLETLRADIAKSEKLKNGPSKTRRLRPDSHPGSNGPYTCRRIAVTLFVSRLRGRAVQTSAPRDLNSLGRFRLYRGVCNTLLVKLTSESRVHLP
jgi:hypothetical protein